MAYKDPLDPRARASRTKHYNENKQQYQDREAAKRLAIQEYLKEVKAVPCMDCGVQYPSYVMDLDHRDPSTKLYGPAHLYRTSMKAAIEEVAKCDVVCANCHRERTHNPLGN
jgi:hypothetical protein